MERKMFVYLGANFVNTAFIKKISPAKNTGKETKAIVTFSDGSEEILSCEPDFFDGLSDVLVPAPSGFKSVSIIEDDDGNARPLIQHVVAFRYGGPDNDLIPVSAYNLKDQSVICPDGQIVTPESGIDPDIKTFLDRKRLDLSDLKYFESKPTE